MNSLDVGRIIRLENVQNIFERLIYVQFTSYFKGGITGNASPNSSNIYSGRSEHFNPLNANPTKWLNTLKQFVGNSRPIV